jgi:hypothetical protein
LENLGHFEAYIQKNGESVNCRFKAGEHTKKTVETSILNLSNRLKSKGFKLDAWSFLEESEPFTPLDPEPETGGKQAGGELVNLDLKA